MANHETKTITIYQKNYQLPILNGGSFEEIQSQIKQRQQVIKGENREKKSLFDGFSKQKYHVLKSRKN